MNRETLFLTILALLIPCLASAGDWISYLDQPHTVVLEKFGVPDRITRPTTQALRVFDGNRGGLPGYADENLSFYCFKLGIVFDFDDQGSLRPSKDSLAGEGGEYLKYFGTDGILRVCGIAFLNRLGFERRELPYGVSMGDSAVLSC